MRDADRKIPGDKSGACNKEGHTREIAKKPRVDGVCVSAATETEIR